MSKAFRRGTAILLLLLVAVVAALMAAAWTVLPLDAVALTLHGQTISLADLHGGQALLAFGLAVGIVVIAAIAALAAVALGLAFAALGLAIGLLATLGSLALAAAPFVFVGWLLWRLVRPRPSAAVAAP